ncbi:MAG: PAS domain S-box protein [Cyanobacteria bacterium J06639_1]
MAQFDSGVAWLFDSSAIAWGVAALGWLGFAGSRWWSARVRSRWLNERERAIARALQEEADKRDRVERELRASQHFLQVVMDNIPQAIFWKDRQSVYLGCNRVQAKLSGLSAPEEIAGKTDFDLPWTFAQAEWYRHCDREVMVRDTPQYRIVEMQLRTDGCQSWIETNKIPLHDDHGTVVGILGTYEDITERKEAELALRQAEAKYRAIFNNAIEGIFQSTASGRYLSANPALARIYGYASPEALIAAVDDIATQLYVDPQVRADFVAQVERAGSVTDFEARIWRGDDMIWISESAREVRDRDGTLLYYEGTVVDITERKRAEAQLERTLSLLQATLEATADGIVVVDPDERIVLWNQRYADLFHVPAHLLQEGQSDRALIAHLQQQMRSPEQFIEAAIASYRQLQTVHVTTLELLDGTIVERHSHPQAIGDRVVGAVISYRDVTHLKQAQMALERQVHRVRSIARITRAIRESLDSDRIFQTAATELGRALQGSRCLLHAYTATPTPSLPVVAEYLAPGRPPLLKAGEFVPVVGTPLATAVLRADRAIAIDDVSTSPLLDPMREACQTWDIRALMCARTSHQGQPNGLIALQQCDRPRHWTDSEIELLEAVASQIGIAIEQARLLEREHHLLDEQLAKTQALARAKQQADAANQAKGQFLAMMSHEIRTPLNAVLGTAELLQATPLDRQQQQGLKTICSSGDALLALIDDILDYSKIESEPFELNCQPFSLRACIDTTLDVLFPQAAAKGLSIGVTIARRVPDRITGDAPRLRQILTNLLANAIKFTDAGRVVLSVAVGAPFASSSCCHEPFPTPGQSQSFRFAVRDTGIGISRDRLDRVFAAFQQADGSMSRRYGGTGLGLAISQRLCERMGGSIGVCSQMGQGSVFYFEIPFPVADSTPSATSPLGRATSEFEPPPEFSPTPVGEQPRPQARSVSNPVISNPIISSPVISNPVISNAVIGAIAHPPAVALLPNDGRPAVALRPNAPRVLVVEDVPVNRTVARQMLACLGYATDVAGHGREALRILRTADYDIAFMDLQMPTMDGLEATRRIRQLGNAIHQPYIIAMTAHAAPRDREACLRAGMDDYIAKPLRLHALDTVLQRCTRERFPASTAIARVKSSPAPAPTACPPEAAASLDLQVLADLREIAGDDYHDLVREVIGNALHDIPPRLQSIRHAVELGGDDDVARAAHALRSLSASIGAVRLASACTELEQSPDRAATLCDRIEQEWQRVQPWLQGDVAGWLS